MAIRFVLDRPLRTLCQILLTGVVLASLASTDWDFSLITRRATALYGASIEGRHRVDEWRAMLDGRRPATDLELLQRVNLFFNRELHYVEDIDLWGVDDYWATPVEALWKGAGDCEDFAIAKYFSLRQWGMPADKLLITYVKVLNPERPHMVLTYYPDGDGEPIVLDSLTDSLEPADARKDLLPVYAFNGEGVWLPDATDATIGSNSIAGDIKQLSRWQDVLNKMKAEGFPVEGNTP
ncbi:transglutaminase-like cysteine peptidase [Pseudomonas sp. SLFW]|uniref:transglutaminase-like cysteine peptidase n=1 Tax=Pseudomonas sp. SLFW TaxID=2683259 RepID=UPI00211468F5|nr:transglutaminase-like cysteine peptidase [Pseudomonas sp. SLFW]